MCNFNAFPLFFFESVVLSVGLTSFIAKQPPIPFLERK